MSLDPTDADIGVDPTEYEEPPTFRRADLALAWKPWAEVVILDDWDIDF